MKRSIMSVNIYLPPSPVVPAFLIITNITNATNCVVTVSTPNVYVVGQSVHFSVPYDYGMPEINSLTGTIEAVDVTNLIFTVNINTTQFGVWTTPTSGKPAPATIAPAGSMNIYNNSTVPFHSLDGSVGN